MTMKARLHSVILRGAQLTLAPTVFLRRLTRMAFGACIAWCAFAFSVPLDARAITLFPDVPLRPGDILAARTFIDPNSEDNEVITSMLRVDPASGQKETLAIIDAFAIGLDLVPVGTDLLYFVFEFAAGPTTLLAGRLDLSQGTFQAAGVQENNEDDARRLHFLSQVTSTTPTGNFFVSGFNVDDGLSSLWRVSPTLGMEVVREPVTLSAIASGLTEEVLFVGNEGIHALHPDTGQERILHPFDKPASLFINAIASDRHGRAYAAGWDSDSGSFRTFFVNPATDELDLIADLGPLTLLDCIYDLEVDANENLVVGCGDTILAVDSGSGEVRQVAPLNNDDQPLGVGAVVPEPSTALLLCVGLAGLAAMRRRAA